MITTLMVFALAVAVILTLLSTWTIAPFSYYGILILFAIGLALDLIGTYRSSGGWDWKGTATDVLFYGFIFYFVTMQKIMGRKAFQISAGDALREHLLERDAYRGWLRVLVYLPATLIVTAICLAAYWKFGPHGT